VSLLIAHGHPQANRYPLPMVSAEARLVVERINRETVNESIMLRKAISSVLSEAGGKDFNEAVEDLNGE